MRVENDWATAMKQHQPQQRRTRLAADPKRVFADLGLSRESDRKRVVLSELELYLAPERPSRRLVMTLSNSSQD